MDDVDGKLKGHVRDGRIIVDVRLECIGGVTREDGVTNIVENVCRCCHTVCSTALKNFHPVRHP